MQHIVNSHQAKSNCVNFLHFRYPHNCRIFATTKTSSPLDPESPRPAISSSQPAIFYARLWVPTRFGGSGLAVALYGRSGLRPSLVRGDSHRNDPLQKYASPPAALVYCHCPLTNEHCGSRLRPSDDGANWQEYWAGLLHLYWSLHGQVPKSGEADTIMGTLPGRGREPMTDLRASLRVEHCAKWEDSRIERPILHQMRDKLVITESAVIWGTK